MIPRRLCEGLGMACCYTCGSNVDNHPQIVAEATFRPSAQPERGRCADWRALPVRDVDTRAIQVIERRRPT